MNDQNKSSGLLDSLKKSILGNTYKDNNFTDIRKSITDTLINKDTVNNIEFIKTTISQSIDNNFSKIQSIVPTMMNMWENRERIFRYVNYEEITQNIPYCSRALQTLVDEIISPDDITKKSIHVFEGLDHNVSHKDLDIQYVNKLIQQIELEDLSKQIVESTLQFGDQFVEIYNEENNDVPLSQSVLTESEEDKRISNTIAKDESKEFEIEYDVYNEFGHKMVEKKKVTLCLCNDPNDLEPIYEQKNKSDDKVNINFKNLRILLHDARFVVKIQSRRYKLCLGYLVIPNSDWSNTAFQNTAGSKTSNIATNSLYRSSSLDDITGIDRMYSTLMGFVKTHLKSGDVDDIVVNKKDLKTILSKAIQDFDDISTGKLKVRYVPVDRMEHFHLSNRKYFPYGESIFDRSLFNAKVLMALQTALTIKRLSDSTEKRVIYVESSMNRYERNYIEEVKETLQKKRYKLDDFGSLSSIPSMVTSFETLYIPKINDRRPIEFETLQPSVNIQQLSEELKFFRDMLVASLSVPPSYIGLEENNSTKSTLSQESIIFARTVISFQKTFSKHMKSLLMKSYKYVKKEIMQTDVVVTFQPPKIIQTEILAEHISAGVRIVDELQRVGVPIEYSRKKYVSLDWNEIDEFETESKLDKNLKNPKTDEDPQMGTNY